MLNSARLELELGLSLAITPLLRATTLDQLKIKPFIYIPGK
jgi:hypothetical protein